MVNNNTVGACYWECKMKAMKNNLCGNTTDILFGLQVSLEFLLALICSIGIYLELKLIFIHFFDEMKLKKKTLNELF